MQKDAEIWTAALAQCAGFLGKEVWINPEDLTEVVLVIRWRSRAQWKAFPAHELKQLEHQMAQVLEDAYQIVEVAEYQVRKFAPE